MRLRYVDRAAAIFGSSELPFGSHALGSRRCPGYSGTLRDGYRWLWHLRSVLSPPHSSLTTEARFPGCSGYWLFSSSV
jgi:hypothetical protein